MQYYRNSNNPNLLIGITLLLMLAVLVGPNTLPRLLSRAIPGVFDEGIPCDWLRHGVDRANHQSIIGRAADSPISLEIKTGALPSTADGVLTIKIIMVNNSLGTVPIVYNPNEVIVGDNGTSGLGIIFNPPVAVPIGNARQDSASVPESDIRVLGPRQRCVHKIDIPVVNLLNTGLASGTGVVQAFYRSNTQGQSAQPANTLATPIYYDQGLWTGFVTSDPATIPVSSS